MGGLSSIITILSSGAVAAIVSFWLATRRDVNLLRQNKAEELYLNFEHYDRQLKSILVCYYPYVKHEITQTQLQELTAKADPEMGRSFGRLQMLTRIYFPNLKVNLEEYVNGRSAVHAAAKGPDGKVGTLKQFDEALDLFSEISDTFQQGIITSAISHTEADLFGPPNWLKSSIGKLKSLWGDR